MKRIAGTVVTTEGIDLIGKCFGIMFLVPFSRMQAWQPQRVSKMVPRSFLLIQRLNFEIVEIELPCNVSVHMIKTWLWVQMVALCFGMFLLRCGYRRGIFSSPSASFVRLQSGVLTSMTKLCSTWETGRITRKSGDSSRDFKAFKSKDVTWQQFLFKERNFRADAQSHERQREVSGGCAVKKACVQ